MYKVLYVEFIGGVGCIPELYVFNNKPSISDLRKDYWQNIQYIGNKYGFVQKNMNKSENIEVYECISSVNGESSVEEVIRAYVSSKNKHMIDVIGNINMCIISPDWNVSSFELFYNNNNVLSISSTTKKYQRFISSFCFDFDKMKLYKESDCIAKYEIIR